jgi:hypothetical protein
VSGHTLRGHGVVNGKLIADAGSVVSPAVTPGASPVGILTVSNTIVLSGTTVMELDPDNGTNDVLKSASAITYGGTLSLMNLGPLTSGSAFKLFSASSYSGAFTNITPATPGAGLAWDTSALGTSGIIKVVATTPPVFGGVTIVGTDLVFSGSNGVASGQYYVLASTNVALPLVDWSRIATNTFDANGHFTFSDSLIPPLPRRFYRLQLP